MYLWQFPTSLYWESLFRVHSIYKLFVFFSYKKGDSNNAQNARAFKSRNGTNSHFESWLNSAVIGLLLSFKVVHCQTDGEQNCWGSYLLLNIVPWLPKSHPRRLMKEKPIFCALISSSYNYTNLEYRIMSAPLYTHRLTVGSIARWCFFLHILFPNLLAFDLHSTLSVFVLCVFGNHLTESWTFV